MNTNIRLIFAALAFLSSLKMQLGASWLFTDFFAFVYVLCRPLSNDWQRRSMPTFAFLLITTGVIMMSRLVNGTSEFAFIIRLLVIVFNAAALALLLRDLEHYYRDSDAKLLVSREALIAGLDGILLGFATAMAMAFLLPSIQEIFYFSDSWKAWIATFPALLMIRAILWGKPVQVLICTMIVVSIAAGLGSRALLVQAALLFIYAFRHTSWSTKSLLILLIIGYVMLDGAESFGSKHERSNEFRALMILQILDFSWIELLLGRGMAAWEAQALRDLFHLPYAEEFFNGANPHNLPAEMIIRGGVALLLTFVGYVWLLGRKTGYLWLAVIMLIGTSFTTNTGYERFYISIALMMLYHGQTIVNSDHRLSRSAAEARLVAV